LVLPIINILKGRLNLKRTLISIAQFNPDIMSNFNMRDSIIHIPTYSSSNEIESLVVIFVPL
jgi:hypothetical protein